MKHAKRVTVAEIRARAGWPDGIVWVHINSLMRELTLCMGWEGAHGLWCVVSHDALLPHVGRVYGIRQVVKAGMIAIYPYTFDTLKRAQARAKFLAEEGYKD